MHFSLGKALLVTLLIICTVPVHAADLLFVGEPRDRRNLGAEEAAAYQWATENYDTMYIGLTDLAENPGQLQDVSVVWWHQAGLKDLPEAAMSPALRKSLLQFASAGRGILLTGFATQYVYTLGLSSNPPSSVLAERKRTDEWGFYPVDPRHPVFEGLDSPFATLSSGLESDNIVAWWDDPSTFKGRWLADLEWQGGKIACGEFPVGNGKILFVGAGAFDWDVKGINRKKANLARFTQNIISYLSQKRLIPRIDSATYARADLEALWLDDPSYAYNRAKELNLPLIVAFHTETGESREYYTNVIQSSSVEEAVKNRAVCTHVVVDSGKNMEVARKFDILVVPTLVILTPDGHEKNRLTGTKETEKTLSRLLYSAVGSDG